MRLQGRTSCLSRHMAEIDEQLGSFSEEGGEREEILKVVFLQEGSDSGRGPLLRWEKEDWVQHLRTLQNTIRHIRFGLGREDLEKGSIDPLPGFGWDGIRNGMADTLPVGEVAFFRRLNDQL